VAFSAFKNLDKRKGKLKAVDNTKWAYQRFYYDSSCDGEVVFQMGYRSDVCISFPFDRASTTSNTSIMILCSQSKTMSLQSVSFFSLASRSFSFLFLVCDTFF
jgi:hypothetical protein